MLTTELLLFSLFSAVSAHSWVEQVSKLNAAGNITRIRGFPRGNVPRVLNGTPNIDFEDSKMTYMLPPDGRAEATIYPVDHICKSTQQDANQTVGSPMLKAESGSRILLMYQENGHVTLPEASPGKLTSGTVWTYGTAVPFLGDTLLSIHGMWNETGTAGNQRGRLLGKAPFDDGKCYQINRSAESQRRQKLPQRQHLEEEGENLWCSTSIELPMDLIPGTIYTIYWVWDWPSEEPGGKVIKPQIYTTCIDIQIG
ncbi:hypothetical protein B0J12DRAFT_754044 [Macrophomina phaseolina]|uniref:DUF7492 domain-containing protein n=1 Tax=Macrophomina phaseolina TaxID=35725 RepID=A0ABQ8G9I1_9PEZI|nr:hypothetical protein B0J12DRAFT_754044 [Macrophomina phaseolina]